MKHSILTLLLFMGIPKMNFAQQASSWGTWDKLIGTWKGESDGQNGKGGGIFTFSYDLGNSVLIRKAHSEFPVTDKRPAFSHDDLMIIYQDSNKQPAKAIYFDNEGHTINYSFTQTDSSIVLTSEKTANSPIFRLTYKLVEFNVVDTKFETSKDEINFTPYIQGRSRRTK